MMKKLQIYIAMCMWASCTMQVSGQTGNEQEPVRYIGGEVADPNVHDGKLRPAIGTENIQVMRANRTQIDENGGYGWTYNHAPNIVYWNNRFYVQYISGAEDEHIAPVHTMLVSSTDGRNWGKPEVVFPEYKAPDGVKIPDGYSGYMMHQRMGFYVAPDGRLLICGFYGHTEHPFAKGGIGRVVREMYKNGSFGPIYFIRYSSYTHFNEANTSFPFYTHSQDQGFINACNCLLANKLMTLQWIDEDSGNDNYYSSLGTSKDSVEATSFFHRKDGKVVFLWKKSMTALSSDEGNTVSHPVKSPTLVMPGGKNWGQQTKDARYAMVYNPIATQEYRYPLIVTTGDDGILFDHMLVVHGEVPPRRFFGRWKDFGPNYTRGIVEGNGFAPGTDMWLTYSVNKEDIWVSRVPTPIKYAVDTDVKDDFEQMKGTITDWNIYSPRWAAVRLQSDPHSHNQFLSLSDSDRYDYAKATRVFKTGNSVEISFKVQSMQNTFGQLSIDITDQYGNRPIRLKFESDGYLYVVAESKNKRLIPYDTRRWYSIKFKINATLNGNFDVAVDGNTLVKNVELAEAVKSVERLSFYTGIYRNTPDRNTPNQKKTAPLEGADVGVANACYRIDDVTITSK